MALVNFFAEDIEFKLPNPVRMRRWVKMTVEAEGFKLIELNYIFCSDKGLHKINLEYLNHDTFTDIITFDNSERAHEIEGDIFISIDRVRENSNKLKIAFSLELARVIVHGVLHLLGYSDKGSLKRKEMRDKENAYLVLLEKVPRGTN